MIHLTVAQRALYIAAGLCLVLSGVFRFCMLGYLMTALVFLGLAVCLVFYGTLWGRTAVWACRARIGMTALLGTGFVLFLAAEIPVLRYARSDEDTTAPWLIVCGAGVNGSEPSRSMLDRLARTQSWLAENPAGAAVLSGSQGDGEDMTEAQAMYDWLVSHGADPDRLLLEEQAGSSRENLERSLALIAARGGDPSGRVAILSSEYHLYRLRTMGKKLGCQPVMVAAPTGKFVLFVNYAMREAVAMWKLWIFGM